MNAPRYHTFALDQFSGSLKEKIGAIRKEIDAADKLVSLVESDLP